MRTWFDEEDMRAGSLLDEMGAAVERAAIVLVFFSDAYKRSPNCRTEAEYAYKRRTRMIFVRVQEKYVAEGWLGALLGMQLYFDVTGELFETSSKKLVDSVERMLAEERATKETEYSTTAGAGVDVTTAGAGVDVVGGHAGKMAATQPSGSIQRDVSSKCSDWSVDDVANWLHEMKLDAIKEMYLLQYYPFSISSILNNFNFCVSNCSVRE